MNSLEEKLRKVTEELNYYKSMQFAPPGHFYSAIPNLEEIQKREDRLFAAPDRILPAIDLQDAKQVALLERFAEFYPEQPFTENKQPDIRYYFNNPAFSYADGLVLYSMIRKFKPKRIIEVGSGYSSCATLDTNELYFDFNIDCTFVEPYPDLLLKLIKAEDMSRVELLPIGLQDIDLTYFESLEKNDICFIDSTHVGKIGSDVNYIFFQILPILEKGVVIHFHDIFYPFEYPKNWVYEGRAWNENYYLRAFLEFNDSFEMIYFNHYMWLIHKDLILSKMPLCSKNSGGSIWIKKVK